MFDSSYLLTHTFVAIDINIRRKSNTAGCVFAYIEFLLFLIVVAVDIRSYVVECLTV